MELKKYFENTFESAGKIAIRLKLANTPIIGSSMDVIFTEMDQLRKDLLLEKTLGELDFNKVDYEYLNSDEFRNLLIQTLFMSISEINEDKIVYYSKILKNSLETDEKERRYNFDLLKSLYELSIEQLLVLKELYAQQKDIVDLPNAEIINKIQEETGWYELPEILNKKYGIHEEELYFLLKRTESTGLIHEITGGFWDYEGGIFKIDAMLLTLIKKLEIID